MKEEFKVEEQKDGNYKIKYSSVETKVSPEKMMQMYQQLEKPLGESRASLQECEPHIVEARKNIETANLVLLQQRKAEVAASADIPEFIRKQITDSIEKKIEQSKFSFSLMNKDNITERKKQLNKQIKIRETRLNEIRPHMNSVKLKLEKKLLEMKRLAKEREVKK